MSLGRARSLTVAVPAAVAALVVAAVPALATPVSPEPTTAASGQAAPTGPGALGDRRPRPPAALTPSELAAAAGTGTTSATLGATAAAEPSLWVSDGAGVTIISTLTPDGTATDPPRRVSDMTDVSFSPGGDAFAFTPVPATGHTVVSPYPSGAPSVDYAASDAPVAWAPAGDGFLQQSGGRLLAQFTNPGFAVDLGPSTGVTGAAVSPYGGEVFLRRTTAGGSTLLVGPAPFTGFGGPDSPVDLGLSDYAPGNPAVGQAPGESIWTPNEASTYLAFAGALPGGGEPRLFVDHQDASAGGPTYGNPVAVADTGAACITTAPEFSPDRLMLAYLRAAGPSGSECSRYEVHIKLTGADTRYDPDDPDTLVYSSGAGALLPTRLSWAADNWSATRMRISGADRYEVSANTIQFWPSGSADGLVLAGGLAYADALAGGPLATALGGPSLLTSPTQLLPVTATAIATVIAPGGTIYVVGGPASVSDDVVDELQALAWNVVRLGGANRYEVAVNVAKELDSLRGAPSTTAFISSGSAFADALVAGPAAAAYDGPVLLSAGPTLPTVTRNYLDSLGPDATVFAIGGAGAASVAADPRTEVVGGATRYDVAGHVANRFFAGFHDLGLADGRNWPDAVSGGTVMATWGEPILLTDGTNTLPLGTTAPGYAARASIDAVYVFGGPASVPDGAFLAAQRMAGAQTVYFGYGLGLGVQG
jgi:putative cell wall-binding protein